MSWALEISGRVYTIEQSVDTDTIIKSRHCVTSEASLLAPHCLAELAHARPFVGSGPYEIICCSGTFGIGSARIQAPISLAGAGVKAVVASSFAPIFFENCLNGAFLLPVEMRLSRPPETGAVATLDIRDGEAILAWEGTRQSATCRLPRWALRRRGWMETIAAQAAEAGGLAALRARGLRLDDGIE